MFCNVLWRGCESALWSDRVVLCNADHLSGVNYDVGTHVYQSLPFYLTLYLNILSLYLCANSLEYLSSQQALADLARLLAHVKKAYNTDSSQVITVGGSYSGNLAAWFSVKYPAMVDGAVASSGPILAEANFTEYMDVVADSLEYFEGIDCVNALQTAAESVAALAAQGVGSAGYTQLDTDFVTCSPMASTQDLSILLSDLMGNVQGTVQYNKAKPGSFNITTVCDVMLQTTAEQTPYDQFVELASMYRADYGMTCEDASWADTVAYLSATQNDGDNSGRPWTYQTCNEFGYYQTTDSTVGNSTPHSFLY